MGIIYEDLNKESAAVTTFSQIDHRGARTEISIPTGICTCKEVVDYFVYFLLAVGYQKETIAEFIKCEYLENE